MKVQATIAEATFIHFHSISFNFIQFHSISFNFIQFHSISFITTELRVYANEFYHIDGNVVLDGVEEDARRCRERPQKKSQIAQFQRRIGWITEIHVNGNFTGQYGQHQTGKFSLIYWNCFKIMSCLGVKCVWWSADWLSADWWLPFDSDEQAGYNQFGAAQFLVLSDHSQTQCEQSRRRKGRT